MFTIRPAIYSDLDTIVGILREASLWLLGRGIRQWLPEHVVERDIAHSIARGEFYLAEIGGEAAGTFKLQWRDPAVWPDALDDAVYIHALAIRRAHAGRKLGLASLDWAAAKGAEAGRPFLRLDCMAENEALCRYYREAGFIERGIREAYSHRLDVHWRARMFERGTL